MNKIIPPIPEVSRITFGKESRISLHLELLDRLVIVGKRSEIMVTKGERRLGRTIRKLENSVEFSSKESREKNAEKKYREKAQASSECKEDSPVQSLRDLLIRSKDSTEP